VCSISFLRAWAILRRCLKIFLKRRRAGRARSACGFGLTAEVLQRPPIVNNNEKTMEHPQRGPFCAAWRDAAAKITME
jgi:hypothetical protein